MFETAAAAAAFYGSLAVGAVGIGLSMSASNNAAKSQEQLALVNAQAATQEARQRGTLSALQAQLNASLAESDKKAANEAARVLEAQAGQVSKVGRENTRRSREEFARFLASQRASIAASGVLDTSGSPMALLADTAAQDQRAAEDMLFETENSRNEIFAQANAQRNAGTVSGIQALGFKAEAAGARASIGLGASNARLDLLASRAGANAMRQQAVGSAVGSIGSLGMSGVSMYSSMPGTNRAKPQSNTPTVNG